MSQEEARLRARRGLVAGMLLTAGACGGRTDFGSTADDSGPTRASSPEASLDGTTASDAALASDASGEAEPDSLPPCPPDVYVVLQGSGPNLGTFAPDTGTLTMLGSVCQTDESFGYLVALGLGRDGALYAQATMFGGALGGAEVQGLYRINPISLACDKVPFGPSSLSPNSSPFSLSSMRGMAFVEEPSTGSERLYFVGSTDDVNAEHPAPMFFLAHADPPAFAWTPTAWFDLGFVATYGVDFFGGKDLSIVYPASTGDAGISFTIDSVDPGTAALTAEYPLSMPVGAEYDYPPAARWHGDYYFFPPSFSGQAPVNRYRPSDGSWTQVGTTSGVGAAATAACAAD